MCLAFASDWRALALYMTYAIGTAPSCLSCRFAGIGIVLQCKRDCRVSHLCQIHYTTANSQQVLHIVEVQYFLMAINAAVLNLALCWRLKASIDIARVLQVIAGRHAAAESDIVGIDMLQLDCKLVTAKDGGVMYGASYIRVQQYLEHELAADPCKVQQQS